MKNDFIKNNNNVVKKKQPNSANNFAFIIIIVVSLCAVISAVFSVLLYFKSDNIKTAKADVLSTYRTFSSSYYLLPMSNYSTTVNTVLTNSDYSLGEINVQYQGNPYYANNSNFGLVDFNLTISNHNDLTFSSLDVELTTFYRSWNTPFKFFYNENGTVTSSTTYTVDAMTDYHRYGIRVEPFGLNYPVYCNPDVKLLIAEAGSSTAFCYCSFGYKTGFNCNVVKLEQKVLRELSTNHIYVNFLFYDNNNNAFFFTFYVEGGEYANPVFETLYSNTFYNQNGYDLAASGEYQSGYTGGYNQGLSDGQIDGYNNGYDTGYSEGNSAGYNRGYNAGIEHSNNYTFLSLMGAIVDAPVQAFTGLLNFNILGFNMLGFFLGLLTLSLIIWIIRRFLGG